VLPSEAQPEFFQAQRRQEQLREMAARLVWTFAGIAGTVGLCPMPVSDILILAPLQLVMIALVGGLSCRQFSIQAARDYLAAGGVTLGTGYALRLLAQQLVKAVLIAGDAVSGLVAGAYAIGKSAEVYFFTGVFRPPSEFRGEWTGR
jgi:uncharacterized protein (DUF697 family)